MASSKKRVLVVGLTVLDIINYCERFPREDEDMRVVSQRWSSGGNATNTAKVLAQLNVEVYLFSALSSLPEYMGVISELQSMGVDISFCPQLPKMLPCSSCIVSLESSTRTILHCPNNFPWTNVDDFLKIDLNTFDLIHFEGRGFPATGKMLEHAKTKQLESDCQFIISGEMESVRRMVDLDAYILPLVDVLFLSKGIAVGKGFHDAQDAAVNIANMPDIAAKYVICPWGEDGATACARVDSKVDTVSCKAFPPEKVLDTLGAGDTFIAGCLAAILTKRSLVNIISYGCEIAGKKCGIRGFDLSTSS